MAGPENPKEQWNRIVEIAASADLDDVADMSEAEVDAELAKAGFSVEAENRAGQAEHDASVRAAPRPPRMPRPNVWLALPAAAMVAASSLLLMAEPLAVVGAAPDAGGPPALDAGADGGDAGRLP